jgi:hypothetical protein
MNYQEFVERVQHSMHETIYEDSEGRSILIIDLLDAFGLANKLIEAKRTWVGLTDEERNKLWRDVIKWGDPSHDDVDLMKAIEAKLKEKNE